MSQNLNSSFANSSLAIGLFEKAGIKETPPSFICPLFFCSHSGPATRKENGIRSCASLILPMLGSGE
jgi:hypothetical protein